MKSKPFTKLTGVSATLIVFACALAFLYFCNPLLQEKFGLSGFFASELILFAFALLACAVTRQSLREVFPCSRPLVRQILGVPVIWCGMYGISGVVILLTFLFAPEEMIGVSESMSAFLADMPPLLAVLLIAVTPAVCEEGLCRGFLLQGLRPLKNRWLIIALNGLLFGALHLDAYRFAATAAMGCALAYIALKTDNLILCALFHFLNNLPSAFLAGQIPAETADYALVSLASDSFFSPAILISAACFMLFPSPWLFLGGSVLLRKRGAPVAHLTAKLITAGVVSAVCLIFGFIALFSAGYELSGKLMSGEIQLPL